MVMLHETICNDDFQRNTALQCWNNVAIIRLSFFSGVDFGGCGSFPGGRVFFSLFDFQKGFLPFFSGT